MASKKLILLDRDGVINVVRSNYVKSLDEFEYIYGSEMALKKILEAGFDLSICSNQRGVSRGMVTYNILNSIEIYINSSLPKKDKQISYYYCTHAIEDNCECRKPNPGLLNKAMREKNVSSEETIFIGDNLSDYYAACKANIDFILVLSGYGVASSLEIPANIPRYKNLLEFTYSIVKKN